MAEKEQVLTDEDLAQQNIFGIKPKSSENSEGDDGDDSAGAGGDGEGDDGAAAAAAAAASGGEGSEGEGDDSDDGDDEDDGKGDNEAKAGAGAGGDKPPVFSIDDVKDEQLLELMNKKFNVNFETVDGLSDYFSNQAKLRGQDEIITKLVEELKNKSNVLSHFSSENAYKVSELAKSDYPGKEDVLSRVLRSDIKAMDDFDAIALAEKLKRPGDSRVDPLRYKMSKLGLRDLDRAEFADWDEADKELIYGEAEDAKKELIAIQNKVELPKEGGEQASEFLSNIERGVQDKAAANQKAIDDATPIMKSLVTGLTKINPVEGSDFEFEVSLDNDSIDELTEFLVGTAIEGGYDLKSDSAIRELNGLLQQEIWATDGPKITAAHGKAEYERGIAETEKKYENWTPLDEGQQRRSSRDTGKQTDEDSAQKLLNG
jgi:hypothetical protein